jgi:dihydroorotase
MTLYLSPDLTPAEIHTAKEAGIVGVKSYPRGVTTNSEGGIENYEMYYPVFEAMQEVGMVLNLHGEVPSDPTTVSLHQIPFPYPIYINNPFPRTHTS